MGSAFNTTRLGQTNAIIEDEDGRCLLIDCGSDCRHMLDRRGYTVDQIDAVYISHLHADHVGGMEWLAFSTYFNPKLGRPKLFANHRLMHDLWDRSLRGGLESVQKKVCNLTDYFDTQPIYANQSFMWGGAEFTLVQTVHVMNGMEIVYSYGLMIDACPGMGVLSRTALHKKGQVTRVFYTADTQFAPRQLVDFYADADVIFHDCETTQFRSNVHAHYDDLKTLPDKTREDMYLMHYSYIEGTDLAVKADDDGFAGFVSPGDHWELGATLEQPE